MKSLWKSLWMVCALAGALTAAVGCGPAKAFCPNTGTDNMGTCPIEGDDAQAQGVDGQTLTCPAGQHAGVNPTTFVFECLPN
jgi:hypothetical protein